MENILEKALFVLLGGFLAGIGYLLKRRIERRSIFDAIERNQKLLMLNKELRAQKISLSDLHELEAKILNKEKAAEQYAVTIKKELKDDMPLETKDFITQAEMNEHAYHSFKRADEKLQNILETMEIYLDKTELNILKNAHETWEIFRDKQAEFAANQYKGGSIQPLIYYSELERLTIERAASLQSEIDYFASIGR